MRTSRLLVLALLLAFLLAPLVGATNQQKIYSLDSDLYSAMAALYISEGLSLPSTTGPYSQAEFTLMLEKVNPDKLKGGLLETYNYLVHELGLEPKIQGKGIGLSWNFDANLETYTHTNTTDFVGRDTWVRGWIDQKPLIAIGLETWPSDNFYGYSEFTVGNTYTLQYGFGSTTFGTNIPVVAPAVLMDLDFNMPYRAFVATGGEYWSFQLGRDRLSWGAGTTGNLMISDTLKYHNMARFTSFSDRFKYTFVTSFFPHPSAYYDTTENGQTDGVTVGDGQTDVLDGIYMFMSHRLEGRMFNDKVGLTLTESIMYQSEENFIDLRILNPAAIFHDYYIRDNANSLLGLELDYTPIQGINIYGQLAVDEFSLPGEPSPSSTTDAFPPTFGYLAGVKGIVPMKNTVGFGSIEFAYTDPYLYLRYSSDDSPTSTDYDEYGLSYVVAIREFTNLLGTQYNSSVLGYTYGNDAIVVNLNGGIKSFGKWQVTGNLFYMAHGTFDMFTVWGREGDTYAIVTTPTSDGSDSVGNYADDDYATRDAVSHTIIAGVNSSYKLTKSLNVFGQLDYIYIYNYLNQSGDTANDIQLTMGMTYHI